MGKLIDAMRTRDSRTTNGMVTNSSTHDFCVDLFATVGAIRGEDKQRKINMFVKALSEDALTAMKILFWARDVRGGAGERQTAIDIFEYLAENHTDIMRKNLHLIPEYGRWSDVLAFIGGKLETDALELIAKALESGDQLCAKWMPSVNGKNTLNKKRAYAIRKHLGLSPKQYRKTLSSLRTNIVERYMCAGEWAGIKYAQVPSKAMSDYMKAFGRHDYEGFSSFLNSVQKGEVKINAGAVYPYDITKNLRYGDSNGASVQWTALPNYMEGSNEMVLPMVDVSGSMSCSAGGNAKITCMDVALSLGLYISERNEGPFKDAFLTFSARPELQVLKGNLKERFNQLAKAKWDMNTNIELAFNTLLNKAVASNVEASEMPTMILILSDMEFDSCTRNPSDTAMDMIKREYASAGYEVPKIVFWNLKSRGDKNKPVRFDERGTALVSGFSPALLTGLLSGKDTSPYRMMMDIIGADRYAAVTV